MRSLETAKGPEKALIQDPYAQHLVIIPEDTLKELFKKISNNPDQERSLEDMVNGLAVRSRYIDEKIINAVESGFAQVVVLGAGLDTRPWRLQLQPYFKNPSSLANVAWFELDFPELFAVKLPALKKANATSAVRYHSITADLSLPDWISKLVEQGWDASLPTFWLLEGLTGYLTEEECHKLLSTIYSATAKGSTLLATFITPARQMMLTNMHRFTPADPSAFLRGIGWTSEQYELAELATKYDRPVNEPWAGYFFATARKE
jgi:methyltransferase (TIGR00027 family)